MVKRWLGEGRGAARARSSSPRLYRSAALYFCTSIDPTSPYQTEGCTGHKAHHRPRGRSTVWGKPPCDRTKVRPRVERRSSCAARGPATRNGQMEATANNHKDGRRDCERVSQVYYRRRWTADVSGCEWGSGSALCGAAGRHSTSDIPVASLTVVAT